MDREMYRSIMYQPSKVVARDTLAYQVTPREFQNTGELFLSTYMLPRNLPRRTFPEVPHLPY